MVKVHPNNKYYCLQRLPIFLIISIKSLGVLGILHLVDVGMLCS